MSITQKQIARELGVSHQLVSFALNGGGTVAEKTRQEILAAAERMGYRRNELARAMVTGKSSTLGLLSHEADQTDHLMRVLSGAVDAANEHNVFIKAMHLGSVEDVRNIVNRCVEWRMGGLMVMNLIDDAMDSLQEEAARLHLPVLFVENRPSSSEQACISSDDTDGMRQVIEHLAVLGHRRIAFLNGSPKSRLAQHRERIFRGAMIARGLEVRDEWIVASDWLFRVNRMEDAARFLLELEERPSAIVCAGDPMALATIRVAQQIGLRLPEELSVTGFGNFFLSNLSNPALTTVDQEFRAMGRAAVKQLLDMATETNHEGSLLLLPSHLVARGSTSAPSGF